MKIEFLKLYTSRLKEQREFYQHTLNLDVKKETETSFQVAAGYSVLEFHYSAQATPYHYALHISAKQETNALDWLKGRVGILRSGKDEIVDFPNWNARSLYFYDADKNIVEFISRADLYPSSSSDFTEKNIVGISEIGLATADVEEKFRFLNTNWGLQKFSGDYTRFCAVGDDEGLFIVINKNIKDWIPTGDTAFASPFEIEFSIEKASSRLAFQNDRLELL